MSLILPKNYRSVLNIIETQQAIKDIKDYFQQQLAVNLNLRRVSAPLFVSAISGLNDDLNGVEQVLNFNYGNTKIEVVHSLAKWKRMALKKYNFDLYTGLYTDMNAIRAQEQLDNVHSFYVDQWDWEMVIKASDRNLDYLKTVVNKIYLALKQCQQYVNYKYHFPYHSLPETIHFVHSQDAAKRYPNLNSKEIERLLVKEYGAIFLISIGGGHHDLRACDYDDWNLNGDILVYNPVLDDVIELSSMGIRVDRESLLRQAKITNQQSLLDHEFHQQILNGSLPLTIGGGIGQSRLCMFLLQKAHIGEVQASYWPQSMIDDCKEKGIYLL